MFWWQQCWKPLSHSPTISLPHCWEYCRRTRSRMDFNMRFEKRAWIWLANNVKGCFKHGYQAVHYKMQKCILQREGIRADDGKGQKMQGQWTKSRHHNSKLLSFNIIIFCHCFLTRAIFQLSGFQFAFKEGTPDCSKNDCWTAEVVGQTHLIIGAIVICSEQPQGVTDSFSHHIVCWRKS